MLPPRGPVLVSIPADDWEKPCEPVAARVVSTGIRPEPRVLDAIGEALDTSFRPAFVVGAAVDRDGAWNDVVRLAERHNAAVWVAPMSGRCSFPEDHPLFAGFLPPMREKIVNLLAGHDVIFALGAPAFTYHVEGAGPHLPAGARLVQLIDDPNIAAWTPEGTSAVGSIRLGVLDLLAREPPRRRERPAPRRPPPRAQPALPITFIVLKNRRYAALQEFAPTFGFASDEPLAGTELPDIDFTALARGQGCRGVNLSRAQNLRDALIAALQAPVPTLVEV